MCSCYFFMYFPSVQLKDNFISHFFKNDAILSLDLPNCKNSLWVFANFILHNLFVYENVFEGSDCFSFLPINLILFDY